MRPLRPASPLTPAGGNPVGVALSLADRAWRQAAAVDPLFAPHAEEAFERLETLGEGGMGRVYRIRDRRTGREAALKIGLNPSPEAERRFLREAVLMARLDHPGIPAVFETGRAPDGQIFLLMGVIRGETLGERLRRAVCDKRPGGSRGGDPVRALIDALARVAEAAAAAHEQGVVHRDLKPSNVMVDELGEVLLLDWGVCRDLHEPFEQDRQEAGELEAVSRASVHKTQTGFAVGTPGYMSPEQARGEDVDGRSDVFALGSMLTEILTGRCAIEGESSLIRTVATLDGRVARPRDYDPSLPRELDELCARALAVDPEERLASAAEFAADLRAWLAGEPLESVSYGPVDRLLRRVARSPATVAVTLIVSLGLLLGSALLEQVDRASEAQRLVELETRATELEAERRVAAEDARVAAEAAIREVGLQARTEGLGPTLRARLAKLADVPKAPKLWRLAARIFRNGGDFDSARALLDRAIATSPTDLDLLGSRLELEWIRADGTERRPGVAIRDRILQQAAHQPNHPAVTLASFAKALADEGPLAAVRRFKPELELPAREADARVLRFGARVLVHLCRRGSARQVLYLARRLDRDDVETLDALIRFTIESGDLELADGLAGTLRLMRPGNARLRLSTGRLRIRQGRKDEGLRMVREAAALIPALYADIALVEALLLVKREEEALKTLRRLDADGPDRLTILSHELACLDGLERQDELFAKAEALAREFPRSLAPWRRLELYHSRRAEWARSKAALDRALELDPTSIADRLQRLQSIKRYARVDAIIEAADDVLERLPGNTFALSTRAGALHAKGRSADALKIVERLVVLDPQAGHVWELLAEIYRSQRNPAKVVESYERALKVVKVGRPVFRFRLLRALLEAGRPHRALEEARDLLAGRGGLLPKASKSLLKLAEAEALLDLGRARESYKIYAADEGLARSEGGARLLTRVFAALGRSEAARKGLERLIDSGRGTDMDRARLADLKARDGLLGDALKLIKAPPTRPSVAFHLLRSRILEQAGKDAEAAAVASEALRLAEDRGESVREPTLRLIRLDLTGDRAAARRALQRLTTLSAGPADVTVQALLGECREVLGEREAAIAHYRQAALRCTDPIHADRLAAKARRLAGSR